MREMKLTQAIEKIKSTINLEDYVESLGIEGRENRYVCPLCQDMTSDPAMAVYDSSTFCFKCNTTSDVISLYMNANQVTFIQAVAELAKEIGIKLSLTPKDTKISRTLEIFKEANVYFIERLNKLEGGKNVFIDRYGLTNDSIEKFQLGYCPGRGDTLYKTLEAKGFTPDELEISGLFWKNKACAFCGRLIFPYTVRGQIQYFIARKTQNTPVFKNSKTPTPKYIKVKNKESKVPNPLFNSDVFKNKDAEYFLCTEGISDAMLAIQNKIPTFSPVTARINAKDLIDLKNKHKNDVGNRPVVFCFDNEANGVGANGSMDGAMHLYSEGFNVKVATLPSAADLIPILDFDNLHKQDQDDLTIAGKVDLNFYLRYFANDFTKDVLNKAVSIEDTLIETVCKAGTANVGSKEENAAIDAYDALAKASMGNPLKVDSIAQKIADNSTMSKDSVLDYFKVLELEKVEEEADKTQIKTVGSLTLPEYYFINGKNQLIYKKEKKRFVITEDIWIPTNHMEDIDYDTTMYKLTKVINTKLSKKTIDIPANNLLTKSKLLGLSNKGLIVSDVNASNLVKFFTDFLVTKQLTLERYTKKLGYTLDKNSFVTPEGIFGTNHLNFDKSYEGSKGIINSLSKKGDAEALHKLIASLKNESFGMQLSIGTLLASPLLTPLGLAPFQTHIRGLTSGGKTTSAKIATALLGSAKYINSWNTTEVGFEYICNTLNSYPVILDEIASANKWAIEKIVFAHSNEKGKIRGTKEGGNRVITKWKNTMLSTGEHSFISNFKNNGSLARFLVFDIKSFDFNDRKRIAKIDDVIENNYGHFYNKYIDFLFNKTEDELKADFQLSLKYLTDRVTKANNVIGRQLKSVAVILQGLVYYQTLRPEAAGMAADFVKRVVAYINDINSEGFSSASIANDSRHADLVGFVDAMDFNFYHEKDAVLQVNQAWGDTDRKPNKIYGYITYVNDERLTVCLNRGALNDFIKDRHLDLSVNDLTKEMADTGLLVRHNGDVSFKKTTGGRDCPLRNRKFYEIKLTTAAKSNNSYEEDRDANFFTKDLMDFLRNRESQELIENITKNNDNKSLKALKNAFDKVITTKFNEIHYFNFE